MMQKILHKPCYRLLTTLMVSIFEADHLLNTAVSAYYVHFFINVFCVAVDFLSGLGTFANNDHRFRQTIFVSADLVQSVTQLSPAFKHKSDVASFCTGVFCAKFFLVLYPGLT